MLPCRLSLLLPLLLLLSPLAADAQGADACNGKYTDQASCDADTTCTWCKAAAVPSSCFEKANAKKLPPGVFECDGSSQESVLAEAEEWMVELLEKHGKSLPQWLQNNYTLENLEYFLTPAILEVTRGDNITTRHRVKHDYVYKSKTREGIDPSIIWQIGKAIWNLINDNTPTVDYTIDWTGAVPMNVSDWTQMENFKNWESDQFSFKFKNGVGILLTEFDWTWVCQYGGDYNGVGHYLTNCGASIKKIYAYLTEHVNVSCKGSAPFNYGTHDDPVGGLDLQVVMESNGKFKKTVVGCQITMMGNSTYDIIQCDQH